jgi:hypothetical protein
MNQSMGEPPPNQSVFGLTTAPDNDLLMLSGGSIREFHAARNVWETWPAKSGDFICCFAVDSERLVDGLSTGQIEIQTFRDHQSQRLVDAAGLPNLPTTMTLKGDELWVGGEGFIALVDLKQNRISKFCHISAVKVDHLEIGGGYLWAQYNGHLHRELLSTLR